MHLKRLVIALILVPLLVVYVMYLPPQFFLLLLIAASTIGLAEFYAMSGVTGMLRAAGLVLGGLLLSVSFYRKDLFAPALIVSVLLLSALRLFLKRDTTGGVRETTAAGFGLLYLPCLLSVQLDVVKAGPAWLVMLFFAVWGSDSMAYYVGKGIGRRKLYPEVSPNKTVEGAFGSVAGGIIGVLLIKATVLTHVTLLQTVVLGIAVGIATIVGDLVESMFKRDAGIKDSGSIMPGHGGMLDKLDGVTFAGPAFFWTGLVLGFFR